MTCELSDFDRRLLDAAQAGVLLVPRPWGQLAAQLGVDEQQVLARVAALSAEGGILREVSGLFDAAAVGYAVTLATARCKPDRLDAAGRIVAAHPGVGHCYGRAGQWNLWFTLAVPPDSALGLGRTLDLLGQMIGGVQLLSLPAVRRYKLRVRVDLGGQTRPLRASFDQAPQPCRPGVAAGGRPTPQQVRAIRALQSPLPAAPQPFAQLGQAAGMSGEELLVHAADFLSAGWMRRYAAVLHHRRAGLTANVLVAWQVPPAAADRFGRQASQLAAVSHCYLRATAADWPYNLYTMVHGHDQAQADAAVAAIAAAAGDYARAALPTVREYKKARVRLFSAEFARWEAAAGT